MLLVGFAVLCLPLLASAPLPLQPSNGICELPQFHSFLQLERKRIGANPAFQGCGIATDDQLCLEWLYGAGNNNGNVVESRQWARKTAGGYLNLLSSFGYDGRNRLTTFSETVVSGGSTGGSWGQTNAYDRYGNRWATPTGITQSDWTPTQQSNFDAAKNQITTAKLGVSTAAVTHDVAGYMTVHPQVAGTLVYDAEGRLVSGGGASYSYDGEGRRIKRVAAGSTYWYWYGADGGLIAEDTPEQVEAGVQYLSVDALGSTRLVTKGNQEVAARIDYWPFGEEIVASSSAGNRDLVSGYGGAAALKQRFTGKERDSEMGFDYFGARYLASAQGRWTSPDAPFADQHSDDPQSWNLYGYVRGNPLRYTDPTGRCLFIAGVACGDFAIGAGKAVANIPSSAATLLNRTLKAVTGLNIPDVPSFQAANASQQVGMDSANFAMMFAPLPELGFQKSAASERLMSGTEVVERAMSRAELKATNETGLLRGGREGTHFVSDSVNNSAVRAQERLALPVKPEVKAVLEVPSGTFSPPTRVAPLPRPGGGVLPGGGMERTATGQVPVRVVRTKKY